MTSLLFIVLGLVLLVAGGEFLVRGASGLALKMKITPLIVGLTIVSFATSAPELIVSVQASLNQHPDIAIGNVVGSNIANVGLILGITALAFVMPVTWKEYRKDWWAMVISSLVLGVFIYDDLLSAWEGMALVAGLVFYLVMKVRENKSQQEACEEIPEGADKMKVWHMLLFVIAAIVSLRYGAEFLVKGAVDVADLMGVEERVISLTVVAFGTSIPELAASLMAAFKGHREMAIGNVIGSNIFNILSVLGFSSIITDIPVQSESTFGFDLWWMLGFALVIWPLMSFFSKGKLGRVEGTILFGAYILYIALLV